MPEPTLRLQNLTYDFFATRVVDHLSLDIPAGMIFGLVGPAGAGKTTLLRLLLGWLKPTEGHARVLGFDTRTQGDDIRARVGVVWANPPLYERINAEDNLDFLGCVLRLPGAERYARIQELLTQFGLWERRKEIVGDWRQGLQQNLALARALLPRPAALFLDEPTAGLEPTEAKALWEALVPLAHREKLTIVLTTTNAAELAGRCDLAALIDHGRVLALGRPTELPGLRADASV